MKFVVVTIILVLVCGGEALFIARKIKEPLEIISKNLELLSGN